METSNKDDENDYSNTDDTDLDAQDNTELNEVTVVNETQEDNDISRGKANITQKSSQRDTSKATKTTYRKSRRSKQDEFLEYMKERDKQRQALLQQTVAKTVEENAYDNDVSSFGDHIKSVLQKLPPILKVKAKTEIFKTISKYELMAIENPTSTRTSSSNSCYSTYIIASPIHTPILPDQGAFENECSNNTPMTIFNMNYHEEN